MNITILRFGSLYQCDKVLLVHRSGDTLWCRYNIIHVHAW